MSAGKAALAWIFGILGCIFIIWLIVLGISTINARATPEGGQIGVVRSGPSSVWIGDWFNGHQIKAVVPPGSGSTGIGLGSVVHWYPASSQIEPYTITADPSRGSTPGVDVVNVSSSDGVTMGIEGTFYLQTNFDGTPEGKALVSKFDNRFGVRQFPVVGKDGAYLYPWNGTEGWSAFEDAELRPIINNDLRQEVGAVTCAQLVSSCALVYQQNVNAVKSNAGGVNEATLQKVQAHINQRLEADLAAYLGTDYFSQIKFVFAGKPGLPGRVQDEIDKSQAAFAAVGSSKAAVQVANQQADAKAALEKAYNACPTCARIDEFKALPGGLTTLVLGGSNGTALAVK